MGAKQPINLSNLNIQDVIKNRSERHKATYIIDGSGNAFYLHCGKRVEEKEFESLYPIEIIHNNPKGINVDGTHVK